MPINPVQFAHNVCDEFLRYIFSAFPLSDPELAKQAHRTSREHPSARHPAGQGAVRLALRSVRQGRVGAGDGRPGAAPPVMPGLIGYPSMWLHQEQVFEAVKAGQHVLVATGTGSGKTESFLYPIIDDLLRQRDRGIHDGLTAILVYPMNALANDQLDRLRDMLGGTGITFGQWVGTTPAEEADVGDRPLPRLGSRQPTSPPASSGGKKPRPRTGPCAPWPRPRSAAPRTTSASASPASC